MKKLLALLVALMVLLSCTALAEPSTAYTIAFLDPVIYYNDEAILDMTGLDLELSGYVSDMGYFGIDLGAFVGPEYENTAAYAYAQLDPERVSFGAEGLSNTYTVDLNELAGMDVSSYLSMLPMIPAHTLLNTPIDTSSMSIDLSLPVRYAAVTGALAPYTNGSTITIDKAAGAQLIDQLLASMESAVASVEDSMDIDSDDIAELREVGLCFELNATLTVNGDPAANNGSYTISGSGCIDATEADYPLPFTLQLTDSADVVDMDIVLTEPEVNDVMNITLDSVSTAIADGRKNVNTSFVMENDGEALSLIYSAAPVEGSNQVDYLITLDLPETENGMQYMLSTGTNGDALGFSTALTVFEEGSDPVGFYMDYAGEKIVEESSTTLTGSIYTGVMAEGESYDLSTYLVLVASTLDTSEWAYDSTGSIDIQTMSETDMSTAQMGLMGIAGTALSLISEHVPGLAPILSSLMG